MGKTKQPKITPLSQYQCTDPRGYDHAGYARIGVSFMGHPALTWLSHPAHRVYMHMLVEAKGQAEFKFPRAKYKDWMAPGIFSDCVDELERYGFIIVKQRNKNLRQPNLYRFSDGWKVLESPRPAGTPRRAKKDGETKTNTSPAGGLSLICPCGGKEYGDSPADGKYI